VKTTHTECTGWSVKTSHKVSKCVHI